MKGQRKSTGGGTFDKTGNSCYFAATSPSTHASCNGKSPFVLIAVNEIKSKTDSEAFESMLGGEFKVFLDSGIFNLTNEHARKHGVTMDEALALPPNEIEGFNALWDKYIDLVVRYADRLWGFIELDQGGAENKRKIRARIEKETGHVPIPVYHPFNDGWEYFDELVEGYDRICFGNIVQARAPVRKRLIATAFERQRETAPDVWIHLLGYTPNEWVHALPWYGSADSSTWLAGVRWSSAYGSQAMLKKFGNMPRTMVYTYDDSELYDKAKELAAAQYGNFMSRNWRAAHAERQAL